MPFRKPSLTLVYAYHRRSSIFVASSQVLERRAESYDVKDAAGRSPKCEVRVAMRGAISRLLQSAIELGEAAFHAPDIISCRCRHRLYRAARLCPGSRVSAAVRTP